MKDKVMETGREETDETGLKQTEALGDRKETWMLMGHDSREGAKKPRAGSIDRKTKRASVMHEEEEGG